mgnify:CR=1 FL=1
MNPNLALLALAQGLFLTNNIIFIAINGLVGLSLAPVGWMATLPVMGYVVGGALSTGSVARTQQRYGRKVSFLIGLAVGLLSCGLCALAAINHQFWGLVFATCVAGYYNANAQLYRFAAAELAPTAKEKAVSWVLAGGLLGAIGGPYIATHTKNLMETPFAGAYVTLCGVAVLSAVVISFIQFPPLPPTQQGQDQGRPLSVIVRHPLFIVAALTDWLLDVYYRRVLPAKLAGVASPASRAPPRVELVDPRAWRHARALYPVRQGAGGYSPARARPSAPPRDVLRSGNPSRLASALAFARGEMPVNYHLTFSLSETQKSHGGHWRRSRKDQNLVE